VFFLYAKKPVTLDVELAVTPQQWARGLMFRKELEPGHGMLFIFNNDERLTFWMKNVRFPIDIIFLDKDFVIRKIWKSVPPCVMEPCGTYSSGGDVRYALETEAEFCDMHGITENQKIRYEP